MTAIGAGRAAAVGDTVESRAASTRPGRALTRLRRLKWGVVALLIVLVIIASAAFAPWVAPDDPLAVDIRHRLVPPAWMENSR